MLLRLQGNEAPQPTAFMHASGVLADGIALRQTPASMRAVFGPKATAALACATGSVGARLPLQSTVLFSSVAVTIGAGGQANYVAANSVLDAAAAQLQTRGSSTMSLQWGAWGSAGVWG